MNRVDVRESVSRAHHEEWARGGRLPDQALRYLDIAEEAAAEAFATAVERWPTDGLPPSPGAWLTTNANHKAIDRIRRENKRDDKHKEAQMVYDDDPPEPLGAIDNDRLRLIFTCCHPALATCERSVGSWPRAIGFGPIGGGLILLGIVFGFVTAIVGQLDVTQTWLVSGYVLALFIIVTAFAYHAPNDAKLKAAADASPDDRPSEQLRALVEAPRGRGWVINVVDGLVGSPSSS